MKRVGQWLVLAALFVVVAPLSGSGARAASEETFAARRQALMQLIKKEAAWIPTGVGRRTISETVLDAMGRVPRHRFVPPRLRASAYKNRPLPIGYGQTISQPYIVALMTDLLDPVPGQRALEIGTGSGYQAAVLAELGLEVHSVEIIEPLALSAAARLNNLGYTNLTTRWADGYHGWPQHAPYDAIIVTAASSHIPPPLVAQLKPGGRMVIPVGARFMTQQLLLVEKASDGGIRTRQILPVAFVPLTRER